MVNLLPEVAVVVDLVRHGDWLGERFKCAAGRLIEATALVSALCSETNEFHKRLSFEVDLLQIRTERGTISSPGALNSGLASDDSGLQVNLEIALGGVSAKVKPPNRLFSPAESALRRRIT